MCGCMRVHEGACLREGEKGEEQVRLEVRVGADAVSQRVAAAGGGGLRTEADEGM